MNRRKTSRQIACESLEGRELLSGFTGSAALARSQQRAVQVDAASQRAALRAARVNGVGPHAAANTGSKIVKPNTPVSGTPSSGVKTPATIVNPSKTATNNPLSPRGPSNTPYNLNPTTSTAANANAAAYYKSLAAIFPAQTAGISKSPLVAQPTASTATVLTGLPTGTSAASGGGTNALGLGVASPSTAVPSTAVTTPATTTTPAKPMTPAVPAPGSSAITSPMMAPRLAMPVGPTDGVTLSKAEVAQLKSSVDAFSAAYTSGADAAKDKAAGDALQAGFNDVAMGVWSRTHVVNAASVNALKNTVDTFASTYTSGTNTSTDKTAWNALQAGVTAFGTSLQPNPGAGGGMMMGGGLFNGNPADGIAAMPMGDGAMGVSMLADQVVNGPALSAAEVGKFKAAMTTFASAYTSGADGAKDQTAAAALQNSLFDISASRWDRVAPTDLAATSMMKMPAGTGPMTATGNAAVASRPTGPVMQAPTNYNMARNTSAPVSVVDANGLPTGKA